MSIRRRRNLNVSANYSSNDDGVPREACVGVKIPPKQREVQRGPPTETSRIRTADGPLQRSDGAILGRFKDTLRWRFFLGARRPTRSRDQVCPLLQLRPARPPTE